MKPNISSFKLFTPAEITKLTLKLDFFFSDHYCALNFIYNFHLKYNFSLKLHYNFREDTEEQI